MKITPEDYAILRNEISMLPSDEISQLKEKVKNDPRVKDPAKRLRWDLAYCAGLNSWICAVLYQYLDDSHIDTALRKVVKELNNV